MAADDVRAIFAVKTSPLHDAAPSDDCALAPLRLQCPVPADKPDPGFKVPDAPALGDRPPVLPPSSRTIDSNAALRQKATPPPSADIPDR
ncbi:hypothetical protein HPB47_025801 [Ixodes persulcatus]|uniref:Uncharacterized protein n=1 Tax=Ixodes persulcatus TaxID=34615 RepID=A0AC60Q0H4_IXOPE|nr:hypothetical protein HPB47_025801 [Ixodes persulcatus]